MTLCGDDAAVSLCHSTAGSSTSFGRKEMEGRGLFWGRYVSFRSHIITSEESHTNDVTIK